MKNISPRILKESESQKIQFRVDIRSNADILAPEWPGDILKESEKRLSTAKTDITNWKQAKEEIRNSVSF